MKKLLLSLLITITTTTLFSQLTVTSEADDLTFVYALSGPGVTVSDVVRTCVTDASGFFNSMDANVGIDSGMLLTTGSIFNAPGPNNLGSATSTNGTDGDEDLDNIPGVLGTQDACVLEFDMTVAADTLRLNYVFGSEEYLEYVGSFNDVFAFWVSGPGIPDPVNIALVPGTTEAVAINNVNNITNPEYYVDNGDGFTLPYSDDPFYIQYDGFTTVLEAFALVTAGETYHMKIAIGDDIDQAFDSGVFLETGSLGSLRLAHQIFIDMDAEFAIEKCANGYFTFTNEVPSAEPLVLDYMIEGSATNGIDYETIPDQLIIPAWETTGTIEIVPLHDAIFESLESVVLYLYNPQSGFIYDTVSMLINDELELAEFAASVDDLTVSFSEAAGIATSWQWDFGDDETSTEQNPIHIYTAEGEYEVCLTITDEIGCSDEYCKTVVVGSTGIDELNTASFTISSNPISSFVTIEMIQSSTPSVISIRNVLGQTVISLVASDATITIPTDDLTNGIYFIEVKNGNDIMVQQVEKF